jgi:hypothetical protein
MSTQWQKKCSRRSSMTYIVKHSADLDRVRANTWREVNEQLDAQAAVRIEAAASGQTDPSREIAKLEREWDFERVLQAEASVMGLAGLALAAGVHRGFLLLPGFVAAMVLLHASQGWYPFLPVFRRIGVRSQEEIDRELLALKALRGDFDAVSESGSNNITRAAAAWRAVCA